MSATALKRSAIALFVLGAIVFAAGDPELGLVWVGMAMMVAALFVNFRARQAAAHERNTSTASPLRDSRPDVLYLRSFHTDTGTLRKKLMAGLSSEEEALADAVRPLGDLVAIGQPGESLPLPGAARMYCSHDEWQDAVLVLNLKANDYEVFGRDVRDAFQIALPPIPRFSLLQAAMDVRNHPFKVTSGFILFSEGWRAEFVPLRLRIFQDRVPHPRQTASPGASTSVRGKRSDGVLSCTQPRCERLGRSSAWPRSMACCPRSGVQLAQDGICRRPAGPFQESRNVHGAARHRSA